MKYALHFVDLQNENPWEDKAVYLLYTELLMGFLKVILYLTFITIMMKIHTFPLFAIRPMYLSMRYEIISYHSVKCLDLNMFLIKKFAEHSKKRSTM